MHRSPAQKTPPSPAAIKAEVVSNILAQPLGSGPGRVADLALPAPFVERIAGRVIRSSYRDRYRIVVAESPLNAGVRGRAPSSRRPSTIVRVIEREIPADEVAARRALPEGCPGARGFKAGPSAAAGDLWPLQSPGAAASYELRRASEVVARRLATHGLLDATSEAVRVLGAASFATPGDGALARLRAVGIPTDLLAYFQPPLREALTGACLPDGSHIVLWIARALAERVPPALLRERLKALRFDFRQSLPAFRVGGESGQGGARIARLQLTRGTDWFGPADGGCVDIARQLVAALPTAEFFASIERKHLQDALREAAAWPADHQRRFTLIPEDLPVAQWAQDNGKLGWLESTAGSPQPAMLVPRYAGRGEDGTQFIPGETYLAEGVAAAGIRVVRSPLLFQGGNLVCVDDPKSGQSTLLVGEAEIARNVSLGLDGRSVELALAIEFGADRVVVLPAASYHLDYEVTVRAVTGSDPRVVAIVNDTPLGVAGAIEAGVRALERVGVLDVSAADFAKKRLAAFRASRDPTEVCAIVEAVWAPISRQARVYGEFPQRLADAFAWPDDPGVGAFGVFLSALDTLGGLAPPGRRPTGDLHLGAVYESVSETEQSRTEIRRRLSELNWEVVCIPAIADGHASLAALNGLQVNGAYLMPVTGGSFGGVDADAAAAVASAFGNSVRVIPIRAAESFRRDGGVRCSAMVLCR